MRRLAAWSAALALAFAVFVALGVWQVQRLAWKEGLIARVEQHRHARPQPAPGPDAWAHLTREADEYRRVVVEGRFDHQRSTLVTATTELGSGYWVLTPLLRKDGSWLLVNRGFVPVDRRDSVVNDATANGDENVIGLLRFTEPGGAFLRQNDAASGRWYSRDVGALSASLQLGPVVAPFFIDQVAPHAAAHAPALSGAREWPRAGMTVVQFSNNHRIYAATWFALAAMAACAFAYLVLDERRLRSLVR